MRYKIFPSEQQFLNSCPMWLQDLIYFSLFRFVNTIPEYSFYAPTASGKPSIKISVYNSAPDKLGRRKFSIISSIFQIYGYTLNDCAFFSIIRLKFIVFPYAPLTPAAPAISLNLFD